MPDTRLAGGVTEHSPARAQLDTTSPRSEHTLDHATINYSLSLPDDLSLSGHTLTEGTLPKRSREHYDARLSEH